MPKFVSLHPNNELDFHGFGLSRIDHKSIQLWWKPSKWYNITTNLKIESTTQLHKHLLVQ